MRLLPIVIVALLFAGSCKPPVYAPKPTGYFMIDTPERHEYRLFDSPGFPYTFEYPVYAQVVEDTLSHKAERQPYWINVYFPSLGGVINITYKEITNEQPFMTLVQQSDYLSFSHHEKADDIRSSVYRISGRNVSGIVYTALGNAATRYQFTATDSVKHFLRGALYFNVTPNVDSLKPATDFVEQDIRHVLETIKWR